MPVVEREIRLHAKQAEFLHSDSLIAGFAGGRGTGKSYVGALKTLFRAKPDRLYFVGAPTFSDLRDVSWRALTALGNEFGLIRKINRSDYRCWLFNGAEIIGRSADNPERFRGPNLSGVWLDEASQMSREAYELVLPCLREAGEAGWLTGTFTPKGRNHWTYEVFSDNLLVKARTVDNPFLSPAFYEMIRRQYGDSSLAAQELMGEFLDFEGQLIPYDAILSCQSSDCLWQHGIVPEHFRGELYIGVDVGRSRDKTVIWTWERQGDLCFCREMKVLENVPFEQQKIEIQRRLTRWVVKCSIDAGAIGMPLAEDLIRSNRGVVEPIQLSSGTQIRLAERMRVGFETRSLRIPIDDVLREDLMLVTIGDGGTIETGRKSSVGHADRFWAAAIGYDLAYNCRPRGAGRAPVGVGRTGRVA